MNDYKFLVAKRAIANMADSIEDIPAILRELANVSDDEWQYSINAGKNRRQRLITGTCVICHKEYSDYTQSTFREHDKICQKCMEKKNVRAESVMLGSHRASAKKANLPHDLTLAEWLNAKKHFNGKCAYCQQGNIEVVEHFIPVTLGGGTTATNIVPACKACNISKSNRHPDKIKTIRHNDIEHVRSYLLSLQK